MSTDMLRRLTNCRLLLLLLLFLGYYGVTSHTSVSCGSAFNVVSEW